MSTVKRVFVSLFLSIFSAKCTIVNSPSMQSSFRQCLVTSSIGSGDVGQCLGTELINKLQNWDSEPEFDFVDGVTLSRDPKEYREAFNFVDSDTPSFRTIVDSFDHVISRRQMRWDMGYIYPGLSMHIAPSPGTAGVLQFGLDPHLESVNRHSLKEASTGRLIARQFLVPLLLGFKFNVATIIPIIFGILALIAKKAVLLSKISLIISSAFGLGTLLLGNNKYPQEHYGSPAVFPGGVPSHFGGNYNHHYFQRYPQNDYVDNAYRKEHANEESTFRASAPIPIPIDRENDAADVENNSKDQLRLSENLQEVFSSETRKSNGRNFAWTEKESKL
ncbi:hypothetical protein WA026_008508 [Henosepilachna vigintioctopunctata]|uniref:Osiris 10 n=1 Tax=Henosepilachna vigintioctopunctata TaxID=420089 RepID=A0AAW1UIT6_9CUCU